MRQLAAAIALSALAIAAMMGAIGPAGAADLPGYTGEQGVSGYACAPREQVILFEEEGFPPHKVPTAPARTPYYTCVTGTTLLPGEVPPPPEYCCG